MRLRKGTGILAVALLLATGAEAQETYRLSDRDAAVFNLAGKVEVVEGRGSDVVVRVRRGGADGDRLEIATGELRGRETLRVIYPDDRIVYPGMGRGSNTQVRVRDDGTFGGGRGRGGDRVSIRGSGRGLEAWADLVVEVPRGRSLALYLAVGNSEVRGVEGDIMVDTGSGSVTAVGVSGRLGVDTGSGSVVVEGMQGDLGVDTGSGSVRLFDVSGDDVVIDTGSGRVTGERIRTVGLSVDTGSGSIELDDVTARDVVLDTGSGSVDLTLRSTVDRLDVDTGSGSVTVRAPEGLDAEIELETGSGGIDVDFPVRVRSVRRDHMIGTIGDGGGSIRIDTGSGGIRLVRVRQPM